ncbi:MAG: hypothetical protein J0H44_12840 [Alphaproteobacteria bacterium]|nr:hypothetical protein [Alphaproteobacteria bacterium]
MRLRLVPSLIVASGILLSVQASGAQPGIEVHRGDDGLVFGSCVPSLVAENKSAESVSFLQVDVLFILANGEQRDIELQSSYRDGILFPIVPGAKALLKQHLDLSRALGVPCDQVKSRKVLRVLCEGMNGRTCNSPVSAEP